MTEEKAEKNVPARHANQDDTAAKKPYVLNRASTFHEGVEYGHGDTVHLDPERGDKLAEQGVVVPESEWEKFQGDEGKVDEDEAKAQAEAVKAAEEIEASKVRSAEETRAGYNEPAPVRRGRPPKA